MMNAPFNTLESFCPEYHTSISLAKVSYMTKPDVKGGTEVTWQCLGKVQTSYREESGGMRTIAELLCRS